MNMSRQRWCDLRAWLAGWVGSRLVNLLSRSLRVQVVGDEKLEELRQRCGPICFCSWHEILVVPLFHHRFNDGVAVVSEHADGEIIARVLDTWGYTLVRGSTTRGAIRALIHAVRAVRGGHDIGITPDGPRGPRRVAQPGIVLLAQKSGCPIVPMGFGSTRYWEFRSWDRFRLPKPWARAEIRYGEPIFVPSELADNEAVEVWRRRIEEGMTKVIREVEASLGTARDDA